MVNSKNSASNNVVRMLVFAFVLCFFAVESSEARRMGGGRSFGKIPPIKRQAAPPVKKTETTKPSNTQKAVSPNNAANPKRSGMMGMLGGLAAGLGLAALASYLGVGEELMGLLIFGLIALLIGVLIRRMFFKRGLSFATPSGNISSELASQSVTSKNLMPQGESSADSYRDLSPQEDDPEITKFLEVAKEKFIELQSYWSSGKLEKISDFSTPELMDHLRAEYKKEKANAILSVVELKAEFEGMRETSLDTGESVKEAFVRFHGLIREDSEDLTNFNEVWTLLQRNSSGEGWVLSGIHHEE